jgi:hypothetical protein
MVLSTMNSVTEPLRQIAPGHSVTITIECGLDEQPIVCQVTLTEPSPGQQVLDPFPLVVAQSEPPHHWSASNKLTAYESKKPLRPNWLQHPATIEVQLWQSRLTGATTQRADGARRPKLAN